MREFKRQFVSDHLIKRAIEAEIHNFPMVSADVFFLTKFINLCKMVNLYKSTFGGLTNIGMV